MTLLDRFYTLERRGTPTDNARSLRWYVLWACATLLGGLALAFAGWYAARENLAAENQNRRQEIAKSIRRSLETRILVYTEALHGLQSLFEASDHVTRAEFHAYVDRLLQAGHYHGIQAFSFNRYVPKGGLEAFERRVREDTSLSPEGYPDFSVHPGSDLPFSIVVDYIEPHEGNEAAFGYDVSSEQSRLAALLLARDTGQPQITAPIELVQETGTQMSVLYYLPVYAPGSGGMDREERRNAFAGLVTGVLRMGDLLRGSVDPGLLAASDFELVDEGPVDGGPGGQPPEARILFSNFGGLPEDLEGTRADTPELEPLHVGGRTWRLAFHHMEVSSPPTVRMLPAAVLGGGWVLSLLAAAVVLATGTRRRSSILASGLARDLAKSSQEQRILARIFADSLEGILITDAKGCILDVNDAWCRITGYPREEVIGENPRLLHSQWQDKESYRKMWQSLSKEGRWEGELWDRRKDGSLYAVRCSIRAVSDENDRVTHYVGTQHDVTEYLRRNERATFLANHDALTGLPSRTLLIDRIQQAIFEADRQGRSAVVIYVDLDNFKPINDSLGHLAGDKVLQEVANRLTSFVRRHDTVARLGGDEFVVLLTSQADSAGSGAFATNLLETLAVPMTILGHPVAVTASLGVAVYPEDATYPESLLKCADMAMYKAKQKGPGKCRFFRSAADTSGVRRLNLALALRNAVQNDQLALYYQPEVSFESGAICGVEALLRWHHPKRGLLHPSDFLSAVEEEELGSLIGGWVLERACTQFREWCAAAGRDWTIAVNTFPAQLTDPAFPDKVRAVLDASGLLARQLQLELREQDLLRLETERPKNLERVLDLGIHVTLDDFGSGTTSLASLSRWHVHRVKIHGTRVREALERPRNMEMLRAIIAGVRQFQVQVVAEGVETEEQVALLKELGCDSYHGHVFQRPLPARELSSLLKRTG